MYRRSLILANISTKTLLTNLNSGELLAADPNDISTVNFLLINKDKMVPVIHQLITIPLSM